MFAGVANLRQGFRFRKSLLPAVKYRKNIAESFFCFPNRFSLFRIFFCFAKPMFRFAKQLPCRGVIFAKSGTFCSIYALVLKIKRTFANSMFCVYARAFGL